MGNALIDFDSTINLIPLSVAKQIGNLDLKNIKMTLQLEDKSITYP